MIKKKGRKGGWRPIYKKKKKKKKRLDIGYHEKKAKIQHKTCMRPDSLCSHKQRPQWFLYEDLSGDSKL